MLNLLSFIEKRGLDVLHSGHMYYTLVFDVVNRHEFFSNTEVKICNTCNSTMKFGQFLYNPTYNELKPLQLHNKAECRINLKLLSNVTLPAAAVAASC